MKLPSNPKARFFFRMGICFLMMDVLIIVLPYFVDILPPVPAGHSQKFFQYATIIMLLVPALACLAIARRLERGGK